MHELKYDADICASCETIDCLTRCQYMDLDLEAARAERRRLLDGEDVSSMREDELADVRNRKIVHRDVSGLDRTVTWTFDDRGTTTDLTFEADYRVPKPVLKKFDERVAERLNANEADTVLANLRAALES